MPGPQLLVNPAQQRDIADQRPIGLVLRGEQAVSTQIRLSDDIRLTDHIPVADNLQKARHLDRLGLVIEKKLREIATHLGNSHASAAPSESGRPLPINSNPGFGTLKHQSSRHGHAHAFCAYNMTRFMNGGKFQGADRRVQSQQS